MLRQKEITKPCHLEFWSKYLEGCVDSPALFGRKTERNNCRGTSFLFELPTTLVSKLHAYTQSTSFTLQQLATTAVALCLHPEMTDIDMVVLTPYINRSSDKALETVGLFVEPLPICVKYARTRMGSPSPYPSPCGIKVRPPSRTQYPGISF